MSHPGLYKLLSAHSSGTWSGILSYIPSDLLPNFLTFALRWNCILACCVITEIDERMELVKRQVSEPFNQKSVGVNFRICCFLLLRKDVPDIQWHPLGPLLWRPALHGTLLQSQLLVMFSFFPFLFLFFLIFQSEIEFLKWHLGSYIGTEGCSLHCRMVSCVCGVYLLDNQ